MSSSTEQELTLNTLPTNVICKIIGMKFESFNAARLISHRWNNLALEVLANRKRLPGIPWLYFTLFNKRVTMMIHDRLIDYFGIQKWEIQKGCWDKNTVVLTDLPVEVNAVPWNGLARVLQRCSRINCLQMDLNFCPNGYSELIKALNGLAVNKCKFSSIGSFKADQRTKVLEVIRGVNVRSLVLVAWEISQEGLPNFFVEALQSVGSVTLALENRMKGRYAERLRAPFRQSWSVLKDILNAKPNIRADLREPNEMSDEPLRLVVWKTAT